MDSYFFSNEFSGKAMRVLEERNMDGMGPEGKGPRTGRGEGECELDEQDAGYDIKKEILQRYKKGMNLEQIAHDMDDEGADVLGAAMVELIRNGQIKEDTQDVVDKDEGIGGGESGEGGQMGEAIDKELEEEETAFPEFYEFPLVKDIVNANITLKSYYQETPDDLAFDIAEAMYLYTKDNDNLIANQMTSILQKMQFKPSPMLKSTDNLEEIGLEVYETLSNLFEEMNPKDMKKYETPKSEIARRREWSMKDKIEHRRQSLAMKQEDDEELDEEFEKRFTEDMKKYEFNEGLFDSVKSFIGAASDVASGAKAGKEAAKGGKGIGDVLSIAGTQIKANKFRRAYKEMWMGFNKGLKELDPELQKKVANNDKVREAVNQILGNVVEGLAQGKILRVAQAANKAMPGTNPEQAEAKQQEKK